MIFACDLEHCMSSSSNIDILAQTIGSAHSEALVKIFCKQHFPEIDSHHYLLVPEVTFTISKEPSNKCNDLLTAPKIPNNRQKVIWSDEGIGKYQDIVETQLSEIRKRWLDPLSLTSLSVLLYSTNNILNKAAIDTNKTVTLAEKKVTKSKRKPRSISRSEKSLKSIKRALGNNFHTNVIQRCSEATQSTR